MGATGQDPGKDLPNAYNAYTFFGGRGGFVLYQIIYPDMYTDYGKDYWSMRGFLNDVHVIVESVSYEIYFMDLSCLTQLLETKKRADSKDNFFADRGLVILDELTEQNMENAVAGLMRQGYFSPIDQQVSMSL